MELKDITLEAKDLQEVRGGIYGGNSISQSSSNGGVFGSTSVAGHAFNLSPVSVTSNLSQLNETVQGAAISDVTRHSLAVDINASQLDFGGWARRLS
ncbi:MAG: hypothetical protein AB8B93_05910 [Pseudomonadales bacterium]